MPTGGVHSAPPLSHLDWRAHCTHKRGRKTVCLMRDMGRGSPLRPQDCPAYKYKGAKGLFGAMAPGPPGVLARAMEDKGLSPSPAP